MGGYRTKYFFIILEDKIDMFVSSMNTQGICNILWSIAILDLMNQNKKLLQSLWERIISTNQLKINNDGLHQLAQVVMHAQANGIKLDKLPVSLQDRISDAVRNTIHKSSRNEKEYSRLLQDIGFIHEREVSPFDNNSFGRMLTIDYACKERRIAIEFDGTTHFLTDIKKGALLDCGKKENGPTVAKRRLLKRLGWQVINIPYIHDIEIERRGRSIAQKKKKEYLRRKLHSVAA